MFDFFGELKKLKKLEKLSAEPTAYQKTNVLVDHVACIAIVLYYFSTLLLFCS